MNDGSQCAGEKFVTHQAQHFIEKSRDLAVQISTR
jgi:hypothetical protein